MFSKKNNSRQFVQAGMIALILVSGLLLVVGAANATLAPLVNTNDTAVDGNYGAPLYDNSSCAKAVADINEIKYAWFQNNGDYFMMRIETCANSSLTSGYFADLMMDCGQDGKYNENVDRHFTYNWSNDAVNTRDGTISFSFNWPCTSSPCVDGERVPSPNNNYLEWRIKYTDSPNEIGYAVPPNCRDAVNVAFGVFNGSGTLIDTSCTGNNLANCPAGAGSWAWNVPTVVEMKEIKVSDRTSLTPLALGVMGLLLLGGFGAVILYRRKRS